MFFVLPISSNQKSDLLTQQHKLLNANSLSLSSHLEVFPISDLGSGLNYKKKGLNLLITLILNSKVHTLIINHKDRLLRFVYEIILNFVYILMLKLKLSLLKSPLIYLLSNNYLPM